MKKERQNVNKIGLCPEYLILTIIQQGSTLGEEKKNSASSFGHNWRREKHICYLGTNLLFILPEISEKCSHRFYVYCIYIYIVCVYAFLTQRFPCNTHIQILCQAHISKHQLLNGGKKKSPEPTTWLTYSRGFFLRKLNKTIMGKKEIKYNQDDWL